MSMPDVGLKIVYVFLTILLAILCAAVYGVIHDQFTYTISPEYYTLFKFFQFGLYTDPETMVLPFAFERIAVVVVGVRATWWTGLFIGPIIALVGLIHNDAKVMWKTNIRALLITICITAITGLIGLLYGWLFLADEGVSWWLPDGLMDERAFVMVGSMHNFSYLGGLLGMVMGILFHVRIKRKYPKAGNIDGQM